MRNITKILLLIIFAFVVYLLWPRTPDMKAFDPAALAKLEVENWQAQKAGKGFSAVIARYKIFTTQYHFAPISAYRISQSQADALEHLKSSQDQSADPAEENRVLSALTEKYTWIKQQTKGTFDPDAMAREELGWRTLELNKASTDEIVGPLTRILAAFYGGAPEDFKQVAGDLISARALIFGDEAPADDANPTVTAKTTAEEGYKLLKEIAASPAAPAQ